MRTQGEISKIAICPTCDHVILACHVDHIDKEAEQGFIQFFREGYVILTETANETRAREFGPCDCDKTESQAENFLSGLQVHIDVVIGENEKSYVRKEDVIKLSALFGKALSNLKMEQIESILSKEDKDHRRSGQKFQNKKLKYKAAGFAKAAEIVENHKYQLSL